MQDLSDWDILGHHLQNMGPDLNVASEMGRVAAKMHQGTSKRNVSTEYWEDLNKFRYVSGLNVKTVTFISFSFLNRLVTCNFLTKTYIFL